MIALDVDGACVCGGEERVREGVVEVTEVTSGLGWWAWSALAMGLQAFSSRGLSLVRALLFLRLCWCGWARGVVFSFFTGSSESLPLEAWDEGKYCEKSQV